MKKYLSILLCMTAVLSIRSQDITAGVIAHWLMNDEDEVIDQSPTGLDGVFGGGAYTEDRFGVEDEAIFFDGQFDYVVFSDALDEVTSVEGATFSISLWHRTSDVIPNLSPLMCKYAHTGCGDVQRQWALLIAADEGIRFYFASTPDNENYRSVSTIASVAQEVETWYHIVATYDGNQDGNDGQDRVQIYVDNVIQADTLNFSIGELGTSINDGDAPIGMMAYVSTDDDQCGDFNAPGALDDVRIYDRVISAEEVQLLFEEGVTDIDESSAFDATLDVFPSIVEDGSLNLRTSVPYQDVRVSLISSIGELVEEFSFDQLQGTQTIRLDRVVKGAYILRISTADGLVSAKRVLLK